MNAPAMTATVSACKRYRYNLARNFGGMFPGSGALGFLMLNPSTADASQDDPTIRKCIGFATRNGYAGIYVCNLFAYRATEPRELVAAFKRGEDVIGPDNDKHIAGMPGRCAAIVLAWGGNADAHGFIGARALDVALRLADVDARVFILGRTAKGSPRHPLMLAYSSPLIPAWTTTTLARPTTEARP